MEKEYLVLVDQYDVPIGREEKVACHLNEGKLHRAFTALLFDDGNRLLLTKRSQEKMLWPNVWDGTFASHPRENEEYAVAATRRMPEELRFSCHLDYLMKFWYQVSYEERGSEHELCGTVIGLIDDVTKVVPVAAEISDTAFITAQELVHGLKENPLQYCPWMLLALLLLKEAQESVRKKYEKTLASWIDPDVEDALNKAVRVHFPDGKWALVS